jgi:uncharacterized protein YacL
MFIELVEFQGRHVKPLVVKIVPFVLSIIGRLGKLKGRLRRMAPPQMLTAYISLIIGMVVGDMLFKNLPLFKKPKAYSLDGMIDIFLHGVLEPE